MHDANTIVKSLMQWYAINKRDLPWRRDKNPYHIWLSEVMLQQTQVNTVIPYYIKWLEKFPTIQHVAHASKHDILQGWAGLGYYNRCNNFFNAAIKVEKNYGGTIPKTFEEFIQLAGVGQYIASAVLSIAFDKPLPAIDGNIRRIFCRVMKIKKNSPFNTRRISAAMSQWMLYARPGDINEALMDLGALVCKPKKPLCIACPLKTFCGAFFTGHPELYPAGRKIKTTPEYDVVVGLIWKKGKFYIQQRSSKNHLGGLWEFPGGKIKNNESAEQALIREIKEECGAGVRVLSPIGHIQHKYSHFSINMKAFHCAVINGSAVKSPQPNKWITPREIPDYPFPAANHKIFSILNTQGWNV